MSSLKDPKWAGQTLLMTVGSYYIILSNRLQHAADYSFTPQSKAEGTVFDMVVAVRSRSNMGNKHSRDTPTRDCFTFQHTR